MSDKTQFINFISTCLNDNGFTVCDKLESQYRNLKGILSENNLSLKVDDDLFFLKFCYFVFKNTRNF
jgi:hypothetical protein